MEIKCPYCGADHDELRYVQKATEYHKIDFDNSDLESGYFELTELEETIPEDHFVLYCNSCSSSFSHHALKTNNK